MDQVFEHMNGAEMAQEIIEECRRVLKKGGIICIIPSNFIMYNEEFFNIDYTHNYVTTARRLKEIYYNNVFKIISIKYRSIIFTNDIRPQISTLIGRFLIRPKLIPVITLGLIGEEGAYKIKKFFLRIFSIIIEAKI